jgi:hypothetical protein
VALNKAPHDTWWRNDEYSFMNRDAAARALLGRSWPEAEADFERYLKAGDDRVERSEPLVFRGTLPELPRTHTADEAAPRVASRTALADAVRVGYDAHGHVAVARYHEHGSVSVEAVWIADDVLLRFSHEPVGGARVVLSSLVHAERDRSGRPLELRWWFSSRRARRKRFVWAGDRLSHKLTDEYEHELGEPNALRESVRSEYEYDARGLLRVRWSSDVHPPGGDSWSDHGVAWVRRTPKALKAARDLVNDELPRRIARWVERVAPAEPVYGLALMYTLDDPTLPPSLGLGTMAELRGWRATHRSRLADYAWNPAEYKTFDPAPRELVEDQALMDAFALLNRDWELSESEQEPVRTLRRCARTLRDRVDWTRVLERDAGFCVFVVPDEHAVRDASRSAVRHANICSHDQRRIGLRPTTPGNPGAQPAAHPRVRGRARPRRPA